MKTKPFIIYFLTQSLFLGFGISIMFNMSGKDCYFGAIFGLFIGLMITYLYSLFLEYKNNRTLDEILKQHKVIGIILRILLILASYLLLIYALVIYKVFVSSFMLIKTPEIFILIPIIILAAYGAFKGLEVISRIAESLLPISVVLLIFAALGIIGLFDGSNFLPIFTTTPNNFIKTAITFAGISTFPNLLTVHFKDKPKNMLKTYLVSAGIIIAGIIYVNGILGEKITCIYRFPEYMVLKQIKMFAFIEKIENILSIAWIFNIFILAMMAVYSLKDLIPTKKNKLITYVLLFITLFIINRFFAFDYVNELKIYNILPIISIIIPLVIIIPLIYLAKMKKKR